MNFASPFFTGNSPASLDGLPLCSVVAYRPASVFCGLPWEVRSRLPTRKVYFLLGLTLVFMFLARDLLAGEVGREVPAFFRYPIHRSRSTRPVSFAVPSLNAVKLSPPVPRKENVLTV